MTEYEIADLAASKVFQLQGLASMLQVQIASIGEGIQQFMTILFAYMAAAYFVGAKLDRTQAWIFTTLYILWQAWTIAATMARGVFMALIEARFVELQGSGTALESVPVVLRMSASTLLIAALLASLYFMWTIRHPRIQ